MTSSRPPHESADLGRRTIRGPLFLVLRSVLLVTCRALFGMQIRGTRHVPAEGGLLVVGNHLHNADPFLISVALPRPVHYMAKKELMKVPVIGRVIRIAGAFPIDRGRADRAAIRRALAAVNQGIAVGIFPEGTRSKSRRIERVLPGAGLIALQANVPILPVAITGSEQLPFNGSRAPGMAHRSWWLPLRRQLVVEFGEPIEIPRMLNGQRVTSEMATDLMMEAIAAMLPETHRGRYSSSATLPTSTPSSS